MTINSKIELPNKPNQKFDVSKTFKIDSKLSVKGYKDKTEWVPEIDEGYINSKFNLFGLKSKFKNFEYQSTQFSGNFL